MKTQLEKHIQKLVDFKVVSPNTGDTISADYEPIIMCRKSMFLLSLLHKCEGIPLILPGEASSVSSTKMTIKYKNKTIISKTMKSCDLTKWREFKEKELDTITKMNISNIIEMYKFEFLTPVIWDKFLVKHQVSNSDSISLDISLSNSATQELILKRADSYIQLNNHTSFDEVIIALTLLWQSEKDFQALRDILSIMTSKFRFDANN